MSDRQLTLFIILMNSISRKSRNTGWRRFDRSMGSWFRVHRWGHRGRRSSIPLSLSSCSIWRKGNTVHLSHLRNTMTDGNRRESLAGGAVIRTKARNLLRVSARENDAGVQGLRRVRAAASPVHVRAEVDATSGLCLHARARSASVSIGVRQDSSPRERGDRSS